MRRIIIEFDDEREAIDILTLISQSKLTTKTSSNLTTEITTKKKRTTKTSKATKIINNTNLSNVDLFDIDLGAINIKPSHSNRYYVLPTNDGNWKLTYNREIICKDDYKEGLIGLARDIFQETYGGTVFVMGSNHRFEGVLMEPKGKIFERLD